VQGGIWRKGGGAHGGGAAIERDIEKAQLAVINGWSMFPVTTDEVKQGKAVQLIELALRAKGWKS
jgi:plasmid replication initiation protein